MPKSPALIKSAEIQSCIQEVRGKKVILDADLARFYGVETRILNRAVKRNPNKFPPDFIFPLKNQEVIALKSQNGISNTGRGGRRKVVYAFTEYGAFQAANVLRSTKANQTSVLIIQAFVALRDAGKQQKQLLDQLLVRLQEHGTKIGQHDEEIAGIVQFIKELMEMRKAEKKLLN